MFEPKYIAFMDRSPAPHTIVLARYDFREQRPCSIAPTYKGVRFPLCDCMPCLKKYTDHQISKGKHVAYCPLPEGWTLPVKSVPLTGQPCSHPGCLHHISHPCEGCGRIGGRNADPKDYGIVEPADLIGYDDPNPVSV